MHKKDLWGNPDLDPQEIAYDLWRREDCPHGKDLEHWLKAEKICKKNIAISHTKFGYCCSVKTDDFLLGLKFKVWN